MNHLQFLQDVKEHVTAYRRFLTQQLGSDLLPEHFEQLPLQTKQNYLLSYPLEELCRTNDLDHIHLIGSSSGFSKTGAVFWPKRPCDEAGYLQAIEQMFVRTAQIDRKKTLVVECLAFGLWIGGMQIAAALRNIALSGKYRFTITTPGLDLKAAVEVIKAYHQLYEQVLIITNPSSIPLLGAMLRTEPSLLSGGKVSFPVVGEYFTESFREQTARAFGHPADTPFVVWTGYGSADTGDVGVETQATIALRKHYHHHPEAARARFGSDSVPMILAASPQVKLEIIEGHIVVTKDQFIPLVRYDTRDNGGLLTRQELQGEVPDALCDQLPEQMLYVSGRADNAVIFYGTNLYIHQIQEHLLSLPAAMGYGGLFTVHESATDGISSFHFTIYTHAVHADEAWFLQSLTDFLCQQSAEFGIKYRNLSKAAPRPLIEVTTAPVSQLQASVKHKFIQ